MLVLIFICCYSCFNLNEIENFTMLNAIKSVLLQVLALSTVLILPLFFLWALPVLATVVLGAKVLFTLVAFVAFVAFTYAFIDGEMQVQKIRAKRVI